MISRTTLRYRELLAALSQRVQRQAESAYALFRENPAHASLRFKQVHDDPPLYSARVGMRYRAVARRDGDTLIWFWIGSHAEYDALLNSL